MAMEYVGPYQIAQLLQDETVARVSDSATLAASINNGLAKARSDAAGDANAYAGTLFGGTLQLLPNLGIEDLNTVTSPGVRGQAVSGNATTARNYPVNSGGRGVLFVVKISATLVLQMYVATFLNRTFYREFDGTAWSGWWEPSAGTSSALTIKPNLATEDLDTIKTPGIYPQATSGTATTARNYPDMPAGGRGNLTVTNVSASIVAQSYWATFHKRLFYREFDGAAWSAWKEIGAGSAVDPALSGRVAQAETDITVLNAEQDGQDSRLQSLEALTGLSNPVIAVNASGEGLLTFTLADGTTTAPVAVPAGLPTDQVDYVEQFKRRSKTTSMKLKKVNSTDAIEVSCVSPTGLHTTYAFYGSGNGTTSDDYRIQSSIWVGNSTSGTPNKTTIVGPTSNRDFAIEIAPAASGTPTFVPYHGTPTAFAAEPAKIYNGDALVDVSAMAVGASISIDSFEIVQHVYGRHPGSPGVNLIEIWTSQRISPNGLLSVDGKWRALQDVKLGSNYVMMAPVTGSLFDTMVSSLNNSYPNTPGMYGTSTPLPIEADIATSYVFLSSTNRNVGVAFRYNNMADTMRRGKANKNAQATKAFLEHRNADFLKLYNRPWLSGTVVPAGTVHRFSGDYLYMQGPGLFDQFAI